MKKVLITGGSGGIGDACVREFVRLGYTVYFTYNTNEEKARSIEKETGARAVCCDITSVDDINRAAADIGGVDILVNNAGISEIKMFQDITETDWDNMFNVNVKGAFLMTKSVVDNMISNKWGRIINISSMWGEVGASCEVHYSASKSALIGFTKSLAKELAPSGITVNCVTPGFITTAMNNHLTADEISDFCQEIPVMRPGLPSEAASIIAHLADEKSAYITGSVIPVNGGIVM